jgi:hypothetical protein
MAFAVVVVSLAPSGARAAGQGSIRINAAEVIGLTFAGTVTYTLDAADQTPELSGSLPSYGGAPVTITAPAGTGQYMTFALKTTNGAPCTGFGGPVDVPVNGVVDLYYFPTCEAGAVTVQVALDVLPPSWSPLTQLSVHLHGTSISYDAFPPVTNGLPNTGISGSMPDVITQTGLVATFSAITSNGVTCAGTSVFPFSVIRGQQVMVNILAHCVDPEATPIGTNVSTPGPQGPTGSAASVKFGNVTQAGTTGFQLVDQCPWAPNGYFGTSGRCLVVSTTATYSGGVTVCIPSTSPPPASHTLIQCDPDPGFAPCPVAGQDSRLTTQTSDAYGAPLCCGDVGGTATWNDPICVTTQGLSTFAVGPAAPQSSVPALSDKRPLLLVALLVTGLALLKARTSRASAR